MKQSFLVLCTIILFAACNSDTNNGSGINMFGNKGNNNKGKGWGKNTDPVNNNGGNLRANPLRQQLIDGCLTEVGNDPQAREKCDCWVGKIEARFPNIKTASEIPEEIANQLATECLQNFGGGQYNGNNGNNGGQYNDNPYNNNNGTGQAWAAPQRQQWIQGCAQNAQQTLGITQQQANAYCDCLTRKVEQQYTFQQAVRMTAQDFSTPEWDNARMECQMATGY